ncbi:MAG TPA: InlB B-repeat-containing protein, partial [Bacillota bacterium]|nr:InlB B-repeat-containing protein [Bacillota bacterium]
MLLLFAMLFVSLVGCNNGGGEEEGINYTVIYDGNGGYLGNKTYTMRKLQVAENSKLPKYLSEYSQDPYVVSSLGLATRQGYVLKGWYLLENASYTQDAVGSYVYLSLDDGNGTFRVDENGDYVFGYVQDDNGSLIFVYVEEIAEDVDPDTVEYIYMNGHNGWGFYIFDNNNADHVEIYEADGSYTVSDVAPYGTSYLVFDELEDELNGVAEQDLFADVPRYSQTYYPYTEADEGLTRYSFESAYVLLDNLMVSDVNGEYVFTGTGYEPYDAEDPLQATMTRFTIGGDYAFQATDTVVSPSYLTRYSATYVYWDFENDRVNSDLVLYAHWEKKLTVEYIQKSGQITYITQKLTEDNTTSVDLVAGELIGKLETIPEYVGYTFVGWSTSPTEYLPWDFDNDVFPIGTSTLKLYAFMIEGVYTRINSITKLAAIAVDPTGNYVLVKDLDLGGAIYTNQSPLGFAVAANVGATVVPFTGEFVGMGYTISNFTIKVQNQQKLFLADAGVKVVVGLFPYVQDATIEGLTIENVSIQFQTESTSKTVVCELGGAALIGTA